MGSKSSDVLKEYGEIWTRKPRHELLEFKVGDLVRMDPGAHTNKPYYVQILYVNPFPTWGDLVLVTGIPGLREVEMRASSNWGYHWRRMKIIGPLTAENRHLLYDQIIE